MGIYGKNREEWTMCNIANSYNNIVTVSFYDTLGPNAVDFILQQTELTSLCASGVYISKLIKLKQDG